MTASDSTPASNVSALLPGQSEMARLIQRYPWQQTAIGPVESWPLSLRTLVSMMLASRFPMLIFWGKDLLTFYNDAFRPSLGNEGKHPSSLGQRGEESWAESWPVIGPMIYNIMAGGEAVWFEDQKLPIYREGQMGYAYWTYSFSPLTDDNGHINGVLVTCTETTKSIEALHELEQSESRFQNLVRQADVGIIVLTGPHMKVEIVNDAYARLIGRTAKELLGRHLFSIVPEAEPDFRPIIDQVRTENQPVHLSNMPFKVFDAGGNQINGVLNLVYQPYKEEDGKVSGVMALCHDVTQQVLSLRQLEESEAKFRALVQEGPIATCLFTGPEMKVEVANDRMLGFWGKDQSVLGKPVAAALPELEGQPFFQLLHQVYTTGKAYTATNARADLIVQGRLQSFYFDYTYQPIFNNRGEVFGIIGMATDVTEQVLTNKRIKRAEEDLRMAVDAAELGVFTINLTDNQFAASPRVKAFLGFEPEEAITYEAVVDAIQQDHRQAVLQQLGHAIANGARFDVEYPILIKKENKTRWVRTIGTLQQDNDGKQYFSGIINDITEKKLDEIRKNDFIGMVSHELKTPLTSLSGYLQFMQAKAAKKEDTFNTGILQKANRQIGKMTTMINGFLNVSRLESGKIHIDKTRFDMASLLKETEEESLTLISSHPVLFAPVEAMQVYADRDKIGQVINNFISNAAKYSPIRSPIQVACKTINDRVQVSVQDAGIGIGPNDLPRLFDRYYRVGSDATIAGFGIGLYLCKEIIDRHNGQIWVESDPGKGSVFHFALPVAY